MDTTVYNPVKTVAKTVEPPAVIGLISAALITISKTTSIDIAEEVAIAMATGIYGFFCGIKNWIKHRKK